MAALGAYTGAEAFGVTPDIMNCAKQITNGAQPLGAVMAKKEIYDTFMAAGGPDYMLEFAHGYTYSAHPVACAVGTGHAGHAGAGKHGRPRQGAGTLFRERGAQAQGLQARDRHPQLRLAAGFTIDALPGEPAKRPYEIAMTMPAKGLLRALWWRHDPVGPALYLHAREIDSLINALGETLNETA